MANDSKYRTRQGCGDGPTPPPLVELRLKITPELYRAYQRCSWVITHETGRGQLDIMEEMVREFLIRNGC